MIRKDEGPISSTQPSFISTIPMYGSTEENTVKRDTGSYPNLRSMDNKYREHMYTDFETHDGSGRQHVPRVQAPLYTRNR